MQSNRLVISHCYILTRSSPAHRGLAEEVLAGVMYSAIPLDIAQVRLSEDDII